MREPEKGEREVPATAAGTQEISQNNGHTRKGAVGRDAARAQAVSQDARKSQRNANARQRHNQAAGNSAVECQVLRGTAAKNCDCGNNSHTPTRRRSI